MDDDKPDKALPDKKLDSTESNWEYFSRWLRAIFEDPPDEKPVSPEKLYQLFPPASEGQDIINETLQAISRTSDSGQSSQQPILGDVCNEALHRETSHPEQSLSKPKGLLLSDFFQQEKRACSYFLKTGTCKFGLKCRFSHSSHNLATTSGVASGNNDASIQPGRPSEITCDLYERTGKWSYCATCKHNHPRREDKSQK